MRGPTSPVCRKGTPCTAPASEVTLRFTGDGPMSGPIAVAKDGSYSVSLAPGTYVVGFMGGPASEVNIAPDVVRVVSGRTRTVDFQIDTGLR